MGDLPFDITVHHLDGGARVVLSGELDLACRDRVAEELRPLVARYDGAQVVLDCSVLRFVDVTGFAAVVAMARGLTGGRPTLLDACRLLVTILEITGDDRWFELERTAPIA